MDSNAEFTRIMHDLDSIQVLEPLAPVQIQPYVIIVEQPKSRRFRYLSEGKWPGAIRGVNYRSSKKSYPTIQVIGYRGKTSVEVSCVLDSPHKQHPHQLVGREGCENGVCRLPIPEETMTLSFSNLGLYCVKKDDIAKSLSLRKNIGVDPFRGGFSHVHQITPKNLKYVRLCFQVYLEEHGNKIPLDPVVSDIIVNESKPNKLVIVKLSHCVCLASGSEHPIMLFCEKINRNDIEIRFYKQRQNLLEWEGFGSFEDQDIHKEFGISFKAPSYVDVNITKPVEVFIQLRRPSDDVCSESLRFEYLPVSTKLGHLKTGIKRYRRDPLIDVLEQYQEKLKFPSTSQVQQNDNFNYDFQPILPLEKQSFSPINPLGTISSGLPSFCQTWGPSDHVNGFMNGSNSELLNLMDANIGEESNILNQNVLLPNSCAKIPFNNLSLSNNDIMNIGITPQVTPNGEEFTFQFNNVGG